MINLDDRIFEQVKTDSQMWLLLHIAKRINKDASCYPKNSTLEKDCGWGKNKVQKVKKELQDLGLIQVTKRMVEGKQRANNYTVSTDHIGVFVPLSRIKPTLFEGTPKQGTLKEGTPKQGNRSINQLEVLNNINKDIKGNKQNLSPISPKNDLYSQFMEVMDYLSEKSGNKFRFGEKSKVVKSDKYKKVTARLKENSIEDLKAVIDVKCREWSDSVEWSKYLVPKTLFAASNFEKYLDQAENANRQPTPQTKNLVVEYQEHLKKYLTEKQLRSLNGKIQADIQKCGENAIQSQISAFKAKLLEVSNPTLTDSLIFDFCYGPISNKSGSGTTPERAVSKFLQFYRSLSGYKQNQTDLRTEYLNYLIKNYG